MRRGLAYSIFFVLALSSCITQERCFEKFPPDRVRVTTVEYRDTIFPVFIPGYKPVFNWSVGGSVIASSGTAYGKAWTVHDTIFIEVEQRDSTYKVRLDSAIKVISERETEIIRVKEECKESKVERILKRVFWIVILVLLIVLIPRILRRRC